MSWESIGIVPPVQGGRGYSTCPKCSEQRKPAHQKLKCLTVNDQRGNRWWNCHHCGYSGNLDKLEKFKPVYEYAKMPNRKTALSERHRAYLASRGISIETALSALVYERDGKLAFPHFDSYVLQDVRLLDIDWEKKQSIKWLSVPRDIGSVQTAFGLNNLKYNEDGTLDWLIIVEGHIDCLTYYQLGYDNVISVPDGAPSLTAKNFDKKFEWLHSPQMQAALVAAKRIFVLPDNDEAGLNFRNLLAEQIGLKEKIYFAKWPEGYKDHNEIYVGDVNKGLPPLGAAGISSLLGYAYLFPLYGIIRLEHVIQQITKSSELIVPGMSINCREVDQFATVKPQHLWTITGVSGSGKSTWLRWYLTELARNNGFKTALYTPENRPAAREYVKILQCFSRKTKFSEEEDMVAIEFVNEHFININPSPSWFESFGGVVSQETVNTLVSILRYVESLKNNMGVQGYVIDAWNKLDFQLHRESETNYISRMLDIILNFNEKHNLTCFLVAHPSKDGRDKNGNYFEPSLMSISGSAHFKNKTDVGLIVHRNKYDRDGNYMPNGPTLIRWEKVKFEELSVNAPQDRDYSLMTKDEFGTFKAVRESYD